MTQDVNLKDRLLALWEHLGLHASHIAARTSRDVAGVARYHPDRISGLLLCGAVAGGMVIVVGDRGVGSRIAASAREQLPGSRLVILGDCDAVAWSDIAADPMARLRPSFAWSSDLKLLAI